MKVIVIREFGDAKGLAITETPDPTPGKGQIVIRTMAIATGSQDVMIRSGALAHYGFKQGHVLGAEIAGKVSAIGEGVDASYIGRRVWTMGSLGGGYAEQVVAPVSEVLALPANLSPVQAVAIGGAGIVANFGLHHARFKSGEAVLIRGASGPIGIMAVVLLARLGAAVVAITTSNAENGQRLRELGATRILSRSMIDTQGVSENYDVILDLVGGRELATLFGKLNLNGRLVSIGAVAGLPPDDFAKPMFPSFQRSLSFATFSAASVPMPERLAFVTELFAEAIHDKKRIVPQRTMSLLEVVKAHRLLESGNGFGRIVLVPEQP